LEQEVINVREQLAYPLPPAASGTPYGSVIPIDT
jgi:hypothetical protein